MSDLGPDFLFDGPSKGDGRQSPLTLVLAHGAGAPMDSPFMTSFAGTLGAKGIRVARFEFPYMAGRRVDGRKRGPDRPPVLLETWTRVIDALGPAEQLVIGGKSMGGRIASMAAAAAAETSAQVAGVVCLGYPFHPPGKPEKQRTEHLKAMTTKTLVIQGSRDPFGTQEQVAKYDLSKAIRFLWLGDGDHDFKPRKKSGRTQDQNWDQAIAGIVEFMTGLD